MSQSRANAPTLRDVAQSAGVSVSTASRVLNGSARRVAEAYGDRVRAAANVLGYAPNLSAQATARGTTSIVALLVGDIADPYFSALASGVAAGARQAGLTVTIAAVGRDPESEVVTLRALGGQRPRAVILASSRADVIPQEPIRHELGQISARGGRVVTLGGGLDGFRTVELNNYGAALRLGAQLAARGYEDAVLLSGPPRLRTVRDRETGFVEGFVQGGGRIIGKYLTELTRESGAAALPSDVVRELPPGTLVFAVTDLVAIGALAAIRAAGRAVGSDVAVAGFGDISICRDVTPSLTTVRMPLEQLGRLAVHASVDEEWDPLAHRVPFDVLLRDSTPLRASTIRTTDPSSSPRSSQ